MSSRWLHVVRDAALAVVLAAVLGLTANALRGEGSIALLARKDYAILVPCPEGKPAAPLRAEAVDPSAKGVLVVDARTREAHAAWHVTGAISIPYDYLEPKPEERRVLDSRARQVIVYGDGEDPDSGEQLASALSGKGLRNVFYVKGGAPALRRAGSRP